MPGLRPRVRSMGILVAVALVGMLASSAAAGRTGESGGSGTRPVSTTSVEAASGARGDSAPPVTRHRLRPRGRDGGEYRSPVTVVLVANDGRSGSGVAETRYRIDGGRWRTYEGPEEVILDETAESFARWRQAGPGFFLPQPDGSIRSYAGIGMLWYPEEAYGDVAIRLEWRDARTDGCCSNSGVFVRFPDPDAAVLRAPGERHGCQSASFGGVPLAQFRPEWVAIFCGHEIQINDGTADPQATGSIYNFAPVDVEQARPRPQGAWNDYEIRTVGKGDYTVTVIRNGRVINRFVNAPGQRAAREGDPPTDDRQFARGFVGLQNHFLGDVIDFRNVRVVDLSPRAGAFTVSKPGRHTVEYRSVDFAGNVEQRRSVTFTIARKP